MTQDKGGVSILPQPNSEGIVYMDSTILKLTVRNQMNTDVTLQCCVLGSTGPFKVEDDRKIVSESRSAKLIGHYPIDFTVTLDDSANPGVYSMPVAFAFSRDGGQPFHVVKYIKAEIVDDIVTSLQPTIPYVRPKPVTVVHDPDVKIERGEPPPSL